MLKPKYKKGDNLIWNNDNGQVTVKIKSPFIFNNSRVGYYLVGFHHDTWAWEEELMQT